MFFLMLMVLERFFSRCLFIYLVYLEKHEVCLMVSLMVSCLMVTWFNWMGSRCFFFYGVLMVVECGFSNVDVIF